MAATRVLHHLLAHGVDLDEVEVRTDLGTDFYGDTIHYRPDGFHGTITGPSARHRFNPPARPNANADVESSHATIEHEFFDLESFADTHAFIAAAITYQHFFNFARKNRSRSNLTLPICSPSALLTSTPESFFSHPSSSTLCWVRICLDLPLENTKPSCTKPTHTSRSLTSK